jgi:uncharacterized protein
MVNELRFLVGGSTSFDMIVTKLDPKDGLSLINDFERVVIEGFRKEDSLELIKKCFAEANLEYTDLLGQKILECIGEPYIPYFISVFLSAIQQNCDKSVTSQEIEKIYQEKLMGPFGKGYFDYYRQRLGKYPEKLSKAAHNILKEVSLSKDGYPIDLAYGVFKNSSGTEDYDDFRDLLECLSNDFYISLQEKKILFKSKVLKDWWKKYYG